MKSKQTIVYIGPYIALTGSTMVMMELLNNFDREKYSLYYFALSLRMNEDIKKQINPDIQFVTFGHLKNFWSRSFIYKIRLWLSIVERIKEFKTDFLIIDQRIYTYRLLILKILFGLKCKIVCRFGNVASEAVKRNSMEHITGKILYPKTDVVVVPSNLARDSFISFYNFVPEKVKTVYNTINTERFKEVPFEAGSKDRNVILYLASLDSRKDPMCLVKAFHLFLQEETHPDNFELWLVGEGNLKETIRKYADENSIGGKVKLIGNVSNPFYHFSNADLFVTCSHFDGFGIAVAEAVYFKRPVIYSDAPVGVNELLKKHNIGISYKTGDSDDLCKKIRLGFSNEALKLNLQAYDNFIHEISKETFLRSYNEIIEGLG